MKKTLKPFQIKGAHFLATTPHALLADEPGLGKTLQAIAAAQTLRLKRMLVICPASVRLGWAQELVECLGHAAGWDIISYNSATKWVGKLGAAVKWDGIILDESHFLKTPESQRTQAVLGNVGLVRRAKHKWLLSGTPVLNRPRELYPMLKVLHPAFATMSFTAYANRYCAAFFDGYGVNSKGASNLPELAQKLQGFMLRRTKAEVLPELPPKIISRVPLEVAAKDLEEVWAEESLISKRESKLSTVAEEFSQLGDMARLLRLTGLAKVISAAAYIGDLLETENKIVVFAHHREVIGRLEILLSKFGVVVYHGGMSDGQKKETIEKFQGQAARVFIGQIQAAGTGINGLQGVCSTAVFAETDWTPGTMSQAVDRLHRIGQTAQSVNVHILHIPGTLESAVLSVHDAKVSVIERLMNDNILEGLL